MDHLVAEQVRRNRLTQDAWEGYAAHRHNVCRWIVESRPSASRPSAAARLCVLGAGNANDLDLPQLLEAFAEVHLVDLDAEALDKGIARQGLRTHPRIRGHGGVDLSGTLDHLARLRREADASEAEIAACLDALRDNAPVSRWPDWPGPCDVVASTCLLTQLIDAVAASLDARHPRFLELLLAVRDQHLRTLVDWTVAGGRALLITDFVSTDSWPELANLPEAEIPRQALSRIAEGDFFTGANPLAVRDWFASQPGLADRVADVRLSQPWRWSVGPRAYAVCALRIARTAA